MNGNEGQGAERQWQGNFLQRRLHPEAAPKDATLRMVHEIPFALLPELRPPHPHTTPSGSIAMTTAPLNLVCVLWCGLPFARFDALDLVTQGHASDDHKAAFQAVRSLRQGLSGVLPHHHPVAGGPFQETEAVLTVGHGRAVRRCG